MTIVDRLIKHKLVKTDDELFALRRNNVVSFGDLEAAAHKMPNPLKPVLDRYIDWSNTTVVPVALKEMSL